MGNRSGRARVRGERSLTNSLKSLPVLTIGGYLGSGKTTLVNHLLRNANGRRLVVLVNEFGDLAIDEDLIEAEDENLISIAGGCVCCSFGNDLMGALQEMQQLEPPPDHVIIESSGVAIPGAIVATISLLPGLKSDGVVVVVDAETVREAATDDYIGDTILRQLSDADIVVVNKLDLITEDSATALTTWLDQKTSDAIHIPTRHGQVFPDALLGVVDRPKKGHSQDHSDKLFESLTFVPAKPLDIEATAVQLATSPLGVIRAKGYILGLDERIWLIQIVGRRWSVEPAMGEHKIGLICLGFRGQLEREAIARLV